jgi:hypothetical protein
MFVPSFLLTDDLSSTHLTSPVQDFLSSHPSPSLAQEARDRKISLQAHSRGAEVTESSSSSESTLPSHKRNHSEVEEAPEEQEDQPAVSSSSLQSPTLTPSPSQRFLNPEANGFLVSEVITSPHCSLCLFV